MKRITKQDVQVSFDYVRNSAARAGVDSSRWVLDHQPGGWRVTLGNGGCGLFASPRLPSREFRMVLTAAGDAFYMARAELEARNGK